MELKIWLVYLLAVIGLSLTPGPNSLLVLAHGALHGRVRTLWTIAGGAVGFVSLIGLSMLGIGALLQSSAHALTADRSATSTRFDVTFTPKPSQRATVSARPVSSMSASAR